MRQAKALWSVAVGSFIGIQITERIAGVKYHIRVSHSQGRRKLRDAGPATLHEASLPVSQSLFCACWGMF